MVFDIPMEVITNEMSRACGVALDRLYSLRFERKGTYGSGMSAYLTRTLAGQTVKDIAEHFRRSPMRTS